MWDEDTDEFVFKRAELKESKHETCHEVVYVIYQPKIYIYINKTYY